MTLLYVFRVDLSTSTVSSALMIINLFQFPCTIQLIASASWNTVLRILSVRELSKDPHLYSAGLGKFWGVFSFGSSQGLHFKRERSMREAAIRRSILLNPHVGTHGNFKWGSVGLERWQSFKKFILVIILRPPFTIYIYFGSVGPSLLHTGFL